MFPQIVLADYDLFNNTFTKGKTQWVRTGLTCLQIVFFCQQLVEMVHNGKSFLSTNIYQVIQVTLEKGKKLALLDTSRITKRENPEYCKKGTIPWNALSWSATFTGSEEQEELEETLDSEFCLAVHRKEGHTLWKKWMDFYTNTFSDLLLSQKTMFVKNKLSYRHLAAEYGFNILYTNLLWLFRCKLLTWDQNDLSLLTKACWDLLVQISWNQQCISWSFTRYTIIRHKTTSIPSTVIQLKVLYLYYSIAPCATGS